MAESRQHPGDANGAADAPERDGCGRSARANSVVATAASPAVSTATRGRSHNDGAFVVGPTSLLRLGVFHHRGLVACGGPASAHSADWPTVAKKKKEMDLCGRRLFLKVSRVCVCVCGSQQTAEQIFFWSFPPAEFGGWLM